MPLYLVNPAVEMTLELHVSLRLEEALSIQYERIKDRRVRDTFVRRLEHQVESLLKDCLDWDLKEPTEAQLNYAKLVAAQCGVALPSEALKYRFHAAMFLETYAPQTAREQHVDSGGGGAEHARRLICKRLGEPPDPQNSGTQ
ncbi:hypothetical protein [Pseudoxanthomonas suwonensis]|uniref:hypothetical protein n=1 Tax=Pseudoxanthomonas suwonensis TaxID=314722 RepID=UPI00138F7BF0|nr:hypothetical protein [Pseudoxanthomonas suwonensis]